ncbi:MAG: hypothetical protein GX946_09690 [Oligosphaeraceae bacterium]|nr:hypothetical protein [Oligosphaeraceae bacterium]
MNRLIAASNYADLQSAIHAAEEFDTVSVTGIWNTAPIRLKSHMTLRLEAGAKLIASRNMEDYPFFECFKCDSRIGHPWIGGVDLDDVTIEGGTFDASGDAFWTDFDGADSPEPTMLRRKIYKPAKRRPSAMIFYNCRNLTLRNFLIRNSPSYTIWLIGCSNVRIENIRIENHRLSPNTDGLDIDCCSDVFISGCDLRCGDDCIALKSGIALLGENRPCERINISNCIMTTPCCAIRVGYEGDGIIRDVVAGNLIIHNCNKGFDFLSSLPPHGMYHIHRGCRIENMVFHNSVMRDVRMAIAAWSWAEDETEIEKHAGYIRNLEFNNLSIEAGDASFIGGKAVSDIALNHIRMHIVRDMARCKLEPVVELPNVWGCGFLEEPLSIYQAKNIIQNDVRISEERING